MKVAVPCSQHSSTLGQCASSQTEWSSSSRIKCLSRMSLGPARAFTLSHEGFGSGKGSTRWRPIIWYSASLIGSGESTLKAVGAKLSQIVRDGVACNQGGNHFRCEGSEKYSVPRVAAGVDDIRVVGIWSKQRQKVRRHGAQARPRTLNWSDAQRRRDFLG